MGSRGDKSRIEESLLTREQEKESSQSAVTETDRNDDGATKFASPITQPSSFPVPQVAPCINALVWGTTA